jgi:flagellar biosynthesis GTPase FlhF
MFAFRKHKVFFYINIDENNDIHKVPVKITNKLIQKYIIPVENLENKTVDFAENLIYSENVKIKKEKNAKIEKEKGKENAKIEREKVKIEKEKAKIEKEKAKIEKEKEKEKAKIEKEKEKENAKIEKEKEKENAKIEKEKEKEKAKIKKEKEKIEKEKPKEEVVYPPINKTALLPQEQMVSGFLNNLKYGHINKNQEDLKWDPFVCKIEKRIFSSKTKRYSLKVSDGTGELCKVHLASQLFDDIKNNVLQKNDYIKVIHYSATIMDYNKGKIIIFCHVEKL